MRKKQGFTLIELLAVIVILAVIALIATPIIIGIIEDSKVKANENSAYGIIDSAKYYYTQGLLKPENSIEYNTDILGELTYNGGKPKEGSSAFVNPNGEIAVALLYGNKCYLKEYSESKLKEGDSKNCKVTIPQTLSEVVINGPIVTTGSGVYKISDSEYRYRGGCNLTTSSPYTCTGIDPVNNYISIDGQKYRIISVDSQGVKVISENRLSTFHKFDIGTGDDVEAATCTADTCPRNNSNNTFCQRNDYYYGCNVYAAVDGIYTNGGRKGTVTQNSNLYNYLNITSVDAAVTTLRDISKIATWNVGSVLNGSNRTLSTIKTEEKAYTANFKVGIINASDYIEGSINASCQTDPVSSSANSQACRNNNWLYNKDDIAPWVLNPHGANGGNEYITWNVGMSGNLYFYRSDNGLGVRPVAYLSSDISVKGGEGTLANPWIIE